jgi:hypothetical protein
MRTALLCLFILSLVNCSNKKTPVEINSSKLIGCWQLGTDEVNYPGIEFSDSAYCVFRSRGDTIYYFSFQTKGDTLKLIDANGVITNNIVESLNDSELVFRNLVIHETEQRYTRCKQVITDIPQSASIKPLLKATVPAQSGMCILNNQVYFIVEDTTFDISPIKYSDTPELKIIITSRNKKITGNNAVIYCLDTIGSKDFSYSNSSTYTQKNQYFEKHAKEITVNDKNYKIELYSQNFTTGYIEINNAQAGFFSEKVEPILNFDFFLQDFTGDNFPELFSITYTTEGGNNVMKIEVWQIHPK